MLQMCGTAEQHYEATNPYFQKLPLTSVWMPTLSSGLFPIRHLPAYMTWNARILSWFFQILQR